MCKREEEVEEALDGAALAEEADAVVVALVETVVGEVAVVEAGSEEDVDGVVEIAERVEGFHVEASVEAPDDRSERYLLSVTVFVVGIL
jgi:hypothetical protein